MKPKQVGHRHEKVGEKSRVHKACRDSLGGEAATQQLQGTGGDQGLIGPVVRKEFTLWGFFKGDDAARGGRASPRNHKILIYVGECNAAQSPRVAWVCYFRKDSKEEGDEI
jgi:hypothetical protein